MATVALLVDWTFDDASCRRALGWLAQQGHRVIVVGARAGEELRGRGGAGRIRVDFAVEDVRPDQVDALLVPAGVPLNHVRTHERILNFARDVYGHGRPVAVDRPDGWALVRADVSVPALVTWPAVKRVLFVEGPEVADGAVSEVMITSRQPSTDALLDLLLAQLERAPPRGEAPATAEPAVAHT